MFQGASALNLDAKGRISIPTRHRDAFCALYKQQLTLTRHPHGCLLLFPRVVWQNHREAITQWPMSARSWQRIFLGNASDVELDNNGRILIPAELRTAVGLQRDVMLLGMGSHFEIWDMLRLAEDEANALAAGMPESLRDFSF